MVNNIKVARQKDEEKRNKKNVQHQELVKEIQESTKKTLLSNIYIKAEEVSKELEKVLDDTSGLTSAQIFNLITNRCVSPVDIITKKTYTAEELAIAFQLYKEMIAKINEKVTFPPNKLTFCQLLGISSATYNNYKEDPEKADVMQIIDDYILGNILTSAQVGQLEKITSIFAAKAQHGLVEATTPVVIKHEKEMDIETIKKKMSEIKRNAIEVDYEEKN